MRPGLSVRWKMLQIPYVTDTTVLEVSEDEAW